MFSSVEDISKVLEAFSVLVLVGMEERTPPSSYIIGTIIGLRHGALKITPIAFDSGHPSQIQILHESLFSRSNTSWPVSH